LASTISPLPKAPALESHDDIALADRLKTGRDQITSELHKLIVGQEDVIELVLLSLFTGGNSLIVGVPGLAKTLLINTVSQVLDLKFSRIQFTPDLMPSDITGTDIIQDDPETGGRRLVFTPGPIFANIVLADEINRTPPKTQAALLEAMQEHRVTVQGKTYTLKEPFHVFATQNPIELEGTYPLPEAQLDRFMFHIIMDYLPEDDEVRVATTTTAVQNYRFQHAVTGADIVAFQQLIRRVPIADPVARYAVALARTSRPGPNAPDFIKQWVSYGASTRAPQHLILGGKARALMDGRYNVSFDDIRALAKPVMRHRVLTNFHAQSEHVTSDQIIDKLLRAVPLPKSGM
jgi:MoxR-like ATPase